MLESALAQSRELAAPWWTIMMLVPLRYVALEQGDVRSAQVRLAEALHVAQEIGERPAVARGLEAFATLAAALEQPAEALCLAGAAVALRGTITAPSFQPRAGFPRTWVDHGARALGQAPAEATWADGAALTLAQAVSLSLQVDSTATLASSRAYPRKTHATA